MKAVRLYIVLVFMTLLVAAVPAVAADRVALVIGNGSYKFANTLPNPVNDAMDISEKLKTLGFEVYGGNDLDLAGMQRAMRQFAENSPGAKVVLFFYAGHGMEVNGKNYLIPVDAKLESATAINFEVVDANVILNIMVEEKRIAIALLDACRDNPLARSFKKKSRSAVGSGLADVKVDQVGGGGLLYGLATGPGDTASDGEGRNSPFTKALLKHIGTPGVEFEQMMKSVKRDVDTDTKGDQRPYLTSSLLEDLYLVPAVVIQPEQQTPDAAQAVVQSSRVDQDWNLVKNSKSLAVLNAFLAKHSDDALYSGLAEERIAELTAQQVAVASPDAPVVDPPAPLEDAALQPTPETVTEIKFAEGSFNKEGEVWVEKDLAGQTKFTFTGSMASGHLLFLQDTSRDMMLQINLEAKKIFFSVGKGKVETLYDIVSASASTAEEHDVAVPNQPAPPPSDAGNGPEEVSPVTRKVELGKWPEGLAMVDDNFAWVAESGSRQIVKVDFSSGSIVSKVPVGRLPVSMTSGPGGSVFAGVFTEGKIWTQPQEGKGRHIWQLPSKAHVLIDVKADGSSVYAVHYTDAPDRMTTLSRLDAAGGEAKNSEPFMGEGRALAVADGTPWLLMGNGSLAKYDPKSLEYMGGADSNYFLWSLTANSHALYVGGKTAQTPEGTTLIIRYDVNDPQTRIEKSIEGNELITAMAATDTRIAALGENGNVWILDAADLTVLKHFNSGVQPKSALFHNGQLLVTTHQGEGDSGALMIYDGLAD